jgi:serine/threonine protein kinase/Tfp pilus assembly protein PilF
LFAGDVRLIGQRVAHYEVVEKLGEGGMGVVYKARDTMLGRFVALKLLPLERCSDEAARARLIREARLASRLNHPNICTIHEVGESGRRAYIVMELVEGRTLSALLSGGALAAGVVLRIGKQVSEAVAHAHARGVVHRDLKCSNVILTPEDRVKVLDFGLAKLMDAGIADDASTMTATSLTEPGSVPGTLAYMSPELLRGQAADSRSDVWALGVALYEMAAGRRPFEGRTPYELTFAILSQAPASLPQGVPARLRQIIERCLAKEADGRYQTAGELGAALNAIEQTGTAKISQIQTTPGRPRRRGPSRRRVRSVAVLPLANLTCDADQDYFVDGMTEALIAGLAKIQSLRIISRTSVMRYKNTAKSLPEIAAELNVDGVIEGSVLRAGQRVRITAQLIHAATDTHLWAENYERDLQDVLRLQSEVARAIADEIKAAVTPAEARQFARTPQVDPEAFELCLKGRFNWYKLSPEQLNVALEYFQRALEKDSNCALAWAGLARTWLSLGDTGANPKWEAFANAKAASSRALELDDALAEAHTAMANIRFLYEWDWAGAESGFRRAIQLNSNDAESHFFLSDFLISMRRPAEWECEMGRAMELDPLNFFFRCFRGWHLVYANRPDEAVRELQQVLRTEPGFASARLGLWGAFFRKRAYAEALEEAKQFFGILGDNDIVNALETGLGEAGYARAMGLAADTLVVRSQRMRVPFIRIARLYAHAGAADRTLEWLDKSYEARETPLVHLSTGWDWDCLRDEPRFHLLLQKMGLPG